MAKHAPRDATATRARILAAARVHFARAGFDQVGTREIAADAGVDASLVHRYFGSKAKLFEEVIDGAFALAELRADALADLGERLVALILADAPAPAPATGELDALRLLLRAAAAPETAALVAARFHAEFVLVLAKRLRGRDAELRATVIASYVLGLATMKHALSAPALTASATRKVSQLTAAAIGACISPPKT